MATRTSPTWARRLGSAAALAFTLATGSAMAIPAITTFTPIATAQRFNASVDTVGWKFTVAPGLGVTVDALGWWDQTPANPLSGSHQVGLWDMGGTLLASTTVGTTAPLTGPFRYASITPVSLSGSTSYIIGGVAVVSDGDRYTSFLGSLFMDPHITYDGSARNASNGFSFPSVVGSTSGGRFGPNFNFTANTAPVPEPASVAMLLAGLGVVGASRLRRRSAAA